MPSLFEAIPYLSDYKPAFAVLAILCLIILIQNVMTAVFAFASGDQVPGLNTRFDHTKFSFRILRTYYNSVENFPAFGWALLVAVIAGVAPVSVNWLAITHLAFRLAFWGVYYGGIGKVGGGLRSFCYIGGLIANFSLVILTLVRLIDI